MIMNIQAGLPITGTVSAPAAKSNPFEQFLARAGYRNRLRIKASSRVRTQNREAGFEMMLESPAGRFRRPVFQPFELLRPPVLPHEIVSLVSKWRHDKRRISLARHSRVYLRNRDCAFEH